MRRVSVRGEKVSVCEGVSMMWLVPVSARVESYAQDCEEEGGY